MSFSDNAPNGKPSEQTDIVGGLTLSAPDPSYFRSVVRTLARVLDVEIAFAAELTSADEPRRARALSMYVDGDTRETAEYKLEVGPCREVVTGRFCFYPERVRDAYPDDRFFEAENVESYAGIALLDEQSRLLGWLSVASRRPMRDDERVKLALMLVAERTAAELRREVEHSKLRKQYEELENHFAERAVELQRANGALQREIMERARIEEQLAFDALHDPLTRLPNRTMFVKRLEHAIQVNARERIYNYAVLFIDLDRFKVLNDSLGHAAGDQLLRSVAERLASCMRPSDLVARLGGDEFTILLENIGGPSDASRVAERIGDALEEPFRIGGSDVFTTASIGIAFSSTRYASPDDIIRDADTAMYRAKEKGRGRYELFDEQMHLHAVERLQIEMDLRRAIERGEFHLEYQPIVGLATGELNGFEALVRWDHPYRGVIPPREFIPIAEETGMIGPIGMWVFREACRQIQEWNRISSRPLTVSINLSPFQMLDPTLPAALAETLQSRGLTASQVRLEITETSIADERAGELLRQIRALGFELCVDDFGTGYSSLAYLVNMPLNILKIDRAFISAIDSAAEHDEMVRTIVALARNLRLHVIAEGVETRRQVERLVELGCDCAQGFLFARPMPAVDALRVVQTGGTYSALLN